MLFEFLFENYNKALVCFEMVEPCQNQGYCFSASWAKPDGEVDWDDEETFHIFRRVAFEDPDEDEGEFDIADVYFVPFGYLESPTLPNLKKLVNLAKEAGFTEWATDPAGFHSESGILIGTIWEIADYLETELEEYDEDLVGNAVLEAGKELLDYVSDIEINDAEFELPEYLTKLISTFEQNIVHYLQEINSDVDERYR